MKFKFRFILFMLFMCSLNLNGQKSVYWSESSANKLFVADFNDLTKKREIYSGSRFAALAHDTLNDKLYISDSGKRIVSMFDLTTNSLTTIKTGFTNPKDIFYCHTEKKLYLIDDKKIIKMNTDGSGYETVIATLDNPKSIVIDHQNNLIYYTETSKKTINSVTINGSSPKVLVNNQDAPDHLAVDGNGFMYWKVRCGASTCSGLRRAKVNGTQMVTLVEEFLGTVYLDVNAQRLYYTKTSFLSMVYYSDLQGMNEKRYFEGSTSALDLIFSKKHNKIFCANGGNSVILTTFKANDFNSTTLVLSDMYNPAFITLDTINKKILWVNSRSPNTGDNSSGIVRCNYDGTEAEKFVINSSFGNNHNSLCFHPGIQKLFWLEPTKKQILTSNPDGSDIKVLPVTGFSNPYEMVVDLKNDKLIWSDRGHNHIMNCDIDGLNPQVIIDNTVSPQPLHLTLDLEDEKLMWYDNSNKNIFISGLDGSNPLTILNAGIYGVQTLEYNPYDQFIYWSEAVGKSVTRGKKDGSITEPFTGIEVVSNFGRIESFYFSNQAFTSSTSGNMNKNQLTILYPNPALNEIKLNSDKLIPGVLDIYDITGNLVQSYDFEDVNRSFSVNHLQEGMYIVLIRWKDSSFKTHSFIKQSR